MSPRIRWLDVDVVNRGRVGTITPRRFQNPQAALELALLQGRTPVGIVTLTNDELMGMLGGKALYFTCGDGAILLVSNEIVGVRYHGR